MTNERNITMIQMSADLSTVRIGFSSQVSKDVEGEEEAENLVGNQYTITSHHRPNGDFVDAMKKLRKFCLEVSEIEVDAKKLPKWFVTQLKISGDIVMRKSRVQFVLSKQIEKTGKQLKVGPTPQVTMYPEKDDSQRYHNAEAMSKQIEVCIDEAIAYLNGKYEDEDNNQLPLFPWENLQTTFDK